MALSLLRRIHFKNSHQPPLTPSPEKQSYTNKREKHTMRAAQAEADLPVAEPLRVGFPATCSPPAEAAPNHSHARSPEHQKNNQTQWRLT